MVDEHELAIERRRNFHQQPAEPLGFDLVQPRAGLIHEDDLGPADQGLGDFDHAAFEQIELTAERIAPFAKTDETRAPRRPRAGHWRGRPRRDRRSPGCFRSPSIRRPPAPAERSGAGRCRRGGAATAAAAECRSTEIVPSTGVTKPESTLSNVVLPAPLGPISPQIGASNWASSASSGVMPPNCTVSASILIMARAASGICRRSARRGW